MFAHDRVDAVGADEQIAYALPTVGEAGRYTVVALLDGNAGAECDVRVAQGGAQHVMKVRAVHATGGAPQRSTAVSASGT